MKGATLPGPRIPISPEIACWLRISPVKQGENNSNGFGMIQLRERLVQEQGPRRGHSEGNRGHGGGQGGKPEKKKGVLGWN